MAELSLHAGAEVDYEISLSWYLARSARAGDGFEAAVERAMTSIAASPELHPQIDEVHRFCRLRKYPFSVIYRIDGDRIKVVAIAHARRMPGYWSERS